MRFTCRLDAGWTPCSLLTQLVDSRGRLDREQEAHGRGHRGEDMGRAGHAGAAPAVAARCGSAVDGCLGRSCARLRGLPADRHRGRSRRRAMDAKRLWPAGPAGTRRVASPRLSPSPPGSQSRGWGPTRPLGPSGPRAMRGDAGVHTPMRHGAWASGLGLGLGYKER